MVKVTWHTDESIELVSEKQALNVIKRSSGGADPIPAFLRSEAAQSVFELVEAQTIKVQPTVRSIGTARVSVSVDVDDGSDYMLVVRQPSGALTFHQGNMRSADGKRSVSDNRRPQKYRADFSVRIALSADDTIRRGFLDDIVDAVVDGIIVKVKGFVAAKTVDLAEKAIWELLERKQGLHKVSRGADGLQLAPAKQMEAGPNGRALLLIHGTFSTTQGSFGDLSLGDFLDRVAPIYGDAIYGFEHFTVSVTAQKNAEDILKVLPADGLDCDVITQSRGGLVLRNLVERAHMLRYGDRFRLGRAALVASPNEGTQLATPDRWEATVGWIANILDLFPPNPVTSNGAMIARWITWFTKFGVKAAEGLDAMNRTGAQIQELQRPPGPPPGAYSAIVSNFEPDGKIWARALDLGLDWIFGEANDLVVPTAGGFRIDRSLNAIPADQIAVYGPGGNIGQGGSPVHHMNSFGRPETQRFLFNALTGQVQNLPPFDPSLDLPTSKRSTGRPASQSRPGAGTTPPPLDVPEEPRATPALRVSPQRTSNVFELTVVDSTQVAQMGIPAQNTTGSATSFVFAAYNGARVAVPFWLKKSPELTKTGDPLIDKRIASLRSEVNNRRGKIFGYSNRIKTVLSAGRNPRPLSDDELKEFGNYLFEVLLPDDVRRLYDVARTREEQQLFMIFTSMIPWVADLPWEFARDPKRGTFLATQDVHFIRNVLTPTPVDKLAPTQRLRVLVVSAEPDDTVPLSVAEEAAKLQYEMSLLSAQGLVEFEELHRATPQLLHEKLVTGDFDVLHFIGHGYWNKDTGDSGLVLESRHGGSVLLGGQSLREVIARRGLRMVFLNACDTGRGRQDSAGSEMALGGVAQDLFGLGVPNVIANQYPVGDRAAVAFARSVYGFLAQGQTVAEAVREARIAVSLEASGGGMDWAVPVAYARDPDDRLVTSTLNGLIS